MASFQDDFRAASQFPDVVVELVAAKSGLPEEPSFPQTCIKYTATLLEKLRAVKFQQALFHKTPHNVETFTAWLLLRSDIETRTEKPKWAAPTTQPKHKTHLIPYPYNSK